MIRFQCDKCGKSLKANDTDAGRRGKCTRCGNRVNVPVPKAGPAVVPVSQRKAPEPRKPQGVLSELKEHPTWLVCGAGAVVLLAAVVVGLTLIGRSGNGRGATHTGQQASDDRDAPIGSPNEPDGSSGRQGSTREVAQRPQDSSAASTEPNRLSAATLEQTPAPATSVAPPAGSAADDEVLPLWARIVLDGELFPPETTWDRVEGAFRLYSESDPNVLQKPDATWPITPIRQVRPEDLNRRYGPATIAQETNITWHSYDEIAFGVKAKEEHFSQVRAPVRTFLGGFVKTARGAGSPVPSRFFGPDADGVSPLGAEERVVITNLREIPVRVLVGGAGPYRIEPRRQKVLRLPSAYYPVEVRSSGTEATPTILPAFPLARWEVSDDPGEDSSSCIRLVDERTVATEGAARDNMGVRLVNKGASRLTVQIGCEGRYYRLKPNQEIALSVSAMRHTVLMEDETSCAYQVIEATASSVWTIRAQKGRLPFCIEATTDPAVSAKEVPMATSVENPICPIDSSEKAGQVRLFSHGEPVHSVAFSPDGSRLLSASDKEFRLWDVTKREAGQIWRHPFTEHTFSTIASAFEQNGRAVWCSGASGAEMICLDVNTREELGGFKQSSCLAQAVAFSHGARRVLLGERILYLWDLETGELARQWQVPGEVSAYAVSMDDCVLYGTEDGRLFRLDMRTGTTSSGPQMHKGRINAVAFDPNGQLAASGGEDKAVHIWDLQSAREVRHFDGHTGPVLSVAISPNGNRVLSVGSDRTVRVWDTRTGRQVPCSDERAGPILCASFSPDGSLVASGSEDGIVRVWKLEESPNTRKPGGGDGPRLTRRIQTVFRAEAAVTEGPRGRLSLTTSGRGSFLWIVLEADKTVRSGARKMTIGDTDNDEVREVLSVIDPSTYERGSLDLRGSQRGVDAATLRLLQRLDDGSLFGVRGRFEWILLIFEGDYAASDTLRLEGAGVRENVPTPAGSERSRETRARGPRGNTQQPGVPLNRGRRQQ